MKTANIKRVAVVATGAALLAGAVFAAAIPTLDSGFFWDNQGNTKVQVVVGADAAASDGIAAANLAAVIGNKAYVASGTTTITGADIGAVGSVTVESGGAMSSAGSGKTYSTPNEDATLAGTVTQATTFLKRDLLTVQGTDYYYDETLTTTTGLAVAYREDGSDDYAGMYLTASVNSMVYKLEFDQRVNETNVNVEGSELWFLGEKYLVNDWAPENNKIELVKGVAATLGVGQSTDVTVGSDVYTVTLTDARLKEHGTSEGQATIVISGPAGEETFSLDTSSDQSKKTSDGFLIFLDTVSKSYTPGVGGSATLRLGGEVVKLEDGDEFSADTRWDATINTGVNNNFNYLELALNSDGNVVADDVATELSGPMDYFKVQYLGSNQFQDSIEVSDIIVKGDTSNHLMTELTWTDNDGSTKTTKLATQNTSLSGTYPYTSTGEYALSTFYNESGIIDLKDGAKHFIVLTQGKLLEITGADTSCVDTATPGDCNIKVKADEWTSSVEQKCDSIDIIDNVNTGAAAAVGGGLGTHGGRGTFNSTTADTETDFCLIRDVSTTSGSIDFLMLVNSSLFNQGVGFGHGANGQLSLNTSTYNTTDPVEANRFGNFTNLTSTGGVGLLKFDYTPWATDAKFVAMDATEMQIAADTANITLNMSLSPNNNGTVIVNATDADMTVDAVVNYTFDATNPGLTTTWGGVTYINTAQSTVEIDDEYHIATGTTGGLTVFESLSTAETKITVPKTSMDSLVFIGQPVGTVTAAGTAIYTPDSFKSPVTAFTCEANDYDAATGFSFGTVAGNLVIDDTGVTNGNTIVVGGHAVNDYAKGITETALTAAGNEFVDMQGSTLFVAGYTATDTTNAVKDLVTAVKAL